MEIKTHKVHKFKRALKLDYQFSSLSIPFLVKKVQKEVLESRVACDTISEL
ncbi:hypothetical protein HSIEG1_2596 [Enterococcus sp. HSIEG1]|nr:hypothetical protein HSIEG1_2596 [Enterococcus sp. HSIEG1]